MGFEPRLRVPLDRKHALYRTKLSGRGVFLMTLLLKDFNDFLFNDNTYLYGVFRFVTDFSRLFVPRNVNITLHL